jgi:hypothetical protein
MDHIRKALDRVRELNTGGVVEIDRGASGRIQGIVDDKGIQGSADRHSIELDQSRLESHRIVAHNDSDPRSKPFDMLRTQVLQTMDQKSWRILGVTSPTPGCGKTVTAINLALSIARQPERSVLLADFDFRKPQIANSTGINCSGGSLLSVLDGQSALWDAIVSASAGNCHIMILPTESSTLDSSALMASRAMRATVDAIKRDYRSCTVIVDLPPMLVSDDVIAILPQLDCVLLVAAVGSSKVSDIEECNKHLQSTEVVRLVLNKVPQVSADYYPYYGARPSRA